MNENARAMVLTSFAADSLALGVHWIYNTNVIDRKYARVQTLLKPELAAFHRGKDKGDLTHYGDQTLVLLETLAEASEFTQTHFSDRWQALFAHYDGYKDNATKTTLANLAVGNAPQKAGSVSDDLGGAARIAPLVFRYYHDEEKLVQSVKSQTSMTHNSSQVVDAAVVLALAARQVLQGVAPVTALKQAIEKGIEEASIKTMVESGIESREMETRRAIKSFGQMCEVGAAFPATIHLIAKYENNPAEALIQNVMAGGDSAARGMLAGMVLGAGSGVGTKVRSWLDELHARTHIEQLLDRIETRAGL